MKVHDAPAHDGLPAGIAQATGSGFDEWVRELDDLGRLAKGCVA